MTMSTDPKDYLPMPVTLPYFDEGGADVSHFFIKQDYVVVGEGGRVISAGTEGRGFVDQRIAAGQSIFRGTVRFDIRVSTASPDYIANWPTAPRVEPRPVLKQLFGSVKIGIEAVIPNLPACEIVFTGPQKGRLQHPGGDFKIGFTMPGEYRFEFEAFPYMPATTTLKVTL